MGIIAVWLPQPGILMSLEGGAALGKGDSISAITPRRGSLCMGGFVSFEGSRRYSKRS